jgi:hypothetical protein
MIFKRAHRGALPGIIECLPECQARRYPERLGSEILKHEAQVNRSVRQRILAIIAAFAMVTVICGSSAHGFAAHAHDPDHCDWTMHFTGVAGSAPKPAILARPVLAAWVTPTRAEAIRYVPRRFRAHLARAPPGLG